MLFAMGPSCYRWEIPPLRPRQGDYSNVLEDEPPSQYFSLSPEYRYIIDPWNTWLPPSSRPFRIGSTDYGRTYYSINIEHNDRIVRLQGVSTTVLANQPGALMNYKPGRFCGDVFLHPSWESDGGKAVYVTMTRKEDTTPPHSEFIKIWDGPEGWNITEMDYCALSARFCVTNGQEIRVLKF
jgi:hypothetical protein